ncbi:MAG: CvpA family protein [Chloroflexia bacterium]|nr:CvpA family protein [Chloroflexia bacterium]
MVQSIVLDALLLLILMLLVPLGFYRGGMREVCSAAGLLLGLLITNEWAERWGSWVASRVDVRTGVSQFVVAVTVLTLVTALVGYGAAAGFSSRPGPGGRMYGGLIALLTGAVFLGSVINFVTRFLTDGEYPALVENGYLARALSIGLDWVLLGVGLTVVLASVFGMIVRERDTDEYEIPVTYQAAGAAPSAPGPRPAAPRELARREQAPDKIEPVSPPEIAVRERSAAVRVKEVRHWEESPPAMPSDLATNWHRTWPGGTKGSSLRARSEAQATRRPASDDPAPDQQTTGGHDARVIRDWLADDGDGPAPQPRARPGDADE